MSDLKMVKELLKKDCFCHNTELNYLFECMPATIDRPVMKDACGCYHAHEQQIKKAVAQFKQFMETQSRFKVGDRVELAETPEITSTNSWGWLSSKHFLVEGAKATVADISYYGNEFGYSVIFDDESWQDEKGVIHPTNHKHTYFLREHQLKAVSTKSCEFLSKLWYDFYKGGD